MRPGGTLVAKYLEGEDSKELLEEARDMFKKVKVVKPGASRQASKELYLLALNKR